MTDKLRVALGTIYPYDESRIQGGIEAVALYLIRALAKREDVELYVVSCNRTIKQSGVEQRGKVNFHWLATSRRFYSLRAATVDAWRVKRVYGQIRPDIIHCQGIGEYSMAAVSTTDTVLTIHGLESFVPRMKKTAHFKGLPGYYRGWLANWLSRQSIRQASAIVSNSGDYALRLLGARLAGKSIFKIANPIADDFFLIGQTEGESARSPLILWAGQIAERKNLIGLLQAFAIVVSRLPEARLMLTGGVAEPAYWNRVRGVMAALRLEDKVIVAGHVEQAQLLEMYSDAALMVMPSLEETAPMFLAQAMAARKPVVATRAGGIPWMVEDGVTGYLVDVEDVPGMADRMLELLLDADKRKQMGQAARTSALERYAADAVADQTVRAYRELLGGKIG